MENICIGLSFILGKIEKSKKGQMIVGILTELFLSGAYSTSNDKILECDYLSLWTETRLKRIESKTARKCSKDF